MARPELKICNICRRPLPYAKKPTDDECVGHIGIHTSLWNGDDNREQHKPTYSDYQKLLAKQHTGGVKVLSQEQLDARREELKRLKDEEK